MSVWESYLGPSFLGMISGVTPCSIWFEPCVSDGGVSKDKKVAQRAPASVGFEMVVLRRAC